MKQVKLNIFSLFYRPFYNLTSKEKKDIKFFIVIIAI